MKIIIRLVLFLLFLIPVGVKAEEEDDNIQFKVCIPGSGAYNIIYDTEVSTEVTRDKITNEDILSGRGHIEYPANILESDKIKYSFTASRFALECTMNGDQIDSCPTTEQYNKYNVLDKYVLNRRSYVNITFNENTGKFNVKIKDAYGDNLQFRYVSSDRSPNETGLNASNYSGQFLKRTNFSDDNGNTVYGYIINNVEGSTSTNIHFLKLEVYIKKGDCQGSFLATVVIPMPITNDYEISNPAKSNPGYYGCSAVYQYAPVGMSAAEKEGSLLTLKSGYIPECYNSTIKYGEKSSLKSTIETKLIKLQSMFSNYTNEIDNSTIICDNSITNSKLVYSYVGTYWIMNIYEEYTAQGDTAKLVKAGDGFEYVTLYNVKKTSQIIQVNKPSKPPKCEHSQAHGGCSWTNNDGSTGNGWDGGPSEDFDECVSECDGGKYTQKCINSCYQKSYGVDRNVSFSDKFSYSSDESNVQQMCTTESGLQGTEHSTGDDNFCVSEWCEDHGVVCATIDTVSPPGCEDDPDAVYSAELTASLNEFNMLVAKRDEAIKVGNYNYKITDSYLVTSDGKNYIYTVDNINDPALLVEKNEFVNVGLSSDSKEVSLGNDGGGTVSFRETVVKIADIKVSLPLSYVSRITGEVAYKTSVNSNSAFMINSKANKLEKVSKFNILEYYNEDSKERKYYTNIWSKDLNIVVDDDNNTVSLFRTSDYNIKVTSSNVGDGAFSSNIQCFYGVYNNFFKSEDSIDDDDDGGIQYIYRPIDLSDMFPNGRDPRWNWTGTVNTSNNISTGAALTRDESFYADAVNPQAVIESIESKGESIYDVSRDPSEVDYEFVLTKENIRNIRKYNKSVRDYNGDCSNNEGNCHNYLDYNMSCYKNSKGYEVCTSKFMDNINGNSGSDTFGDNMFVTYSVPNFNITSRKNLAGCNNAKNRECFTISR